MQISDLVGQYSRNVANGTEELHGAQSVQKLVSTIGDLAAGSIFEGTINSVHGGKVTLALGNGQTITARLDGKMDLQQGSSMFFQVRANDGQTIAIRPYTELGNVSNPILLNALSAAQVPATDRTLVMVDTMMQEQMSIGRQSILDMAKLVGANPDANVQTGGLSEKIQRGKHTTRHSELMFVDDDTYIMDTPGFSSLYTEEIEAEDLKLYFPEIAAYTGTCKFNMCNHISEPGCLVKKAVSDGRISKMRYDDYVMIYNELKEKRKW